MTKRPLTISSLLHELSRQRACDGHIDIKLAEELTSEILQSGDAIDLKLLRQAIVLQSHVISDMGSECTLPRLGEVSALQAAIRALIGK